MSTAVIRLSHPDWPSDRTCFLSSTSHDPIMVDTWLFSALTSPDMKDIITDDTIRDPRFRATYIEYGPGGKVVWTRDNHGVEEIFG